MSGQPATITPDILVAQIEANRQRAAEDSAKLTQSINSIRQDNAEAFQQIADTLTELKGSFSAANPGSTLGPVAPAEVAQALCDPAARKKAIQAFGLAWLMQTRENKLWPSSALEDDQFMEEYLELKKSGNADPLTASLPTAPANAELLTSANHQASVDKEASDLLPLTPSAVGTSFPFAAAFAGKHVKVDLPKPSKFSRIAVDSDIRAWLLRMQEYLTISGIESKVWTVFASNFLDEAPLQLWEARKTQMAAQPEVLYASDTFWEWCISSFSVQNRERHALSQLEKLRQIGTVAEYKASHDLLAAQTNLPMQLRIFWWERGLKEEIRTICLVDPLTHREYTDMKKAQSAACACDAHLFSAFAAASDASGADDIPVTKRPRVTNNSLQQRRCYNCGRFGHIASACLGQA